MRKTIIGAIAACALTASTLVAPAAFAAPKTDEAPDAVVGAPAEVTRSASPRLAAWQDLQFGLFMHWGVYSSFAGNFKGKRQGIGYPEQIKAWMKISDEDYLAEAAKMDAALFDAGKICETAKKPA